MNKTRYSVRWCKDGSSESESIALLSSDIPFEAIRGFVDSLWEQVYADTRWIEVIDMETGATLDLSDDWDYEEDGCDDDCGFDPYMGCYTDDC